MRQTQDTPAASVAPPTPLPVKVLYVVMGAPKPVRSGYGQRTDSIATALNAACDLRLLVMAHGPDPVGLAATQAAYAASSVEPAHTARWARATRHGWAMMTGQSRWWVDHFAQPAFEAAREDARAFDPDLVIIGHPALDAVGDALGFPRNRMIMDHPDPTSLNYQRAMRTASGVRWVQLYLDREMLRAAERRCADLLMQWVVSDHDRTLVEPLTGAPAVVAPNVVEDRLFAMEVTDPPTDPPVIGFLGNYSYTPNVEAAMEAIRLSDALRSQGVDHTLELVGGGARDAMQAAARARAHVKLRGFVDDVAPVLQRWSFMLAPIRTGTGTKLKILQCFALGVPVVTTSIGAEGMPVRGAGPEADGLAMVADDEAGLLDASRRLLRDHEVRHGLRDRARAWAWRHASQTHLNAVIRGHLARARSLLAQRPNAAPPISSFPLPAAHD